MKTTMTTALVIALSALALAASAQDNKRPEGKPPMEGASESRQMMPLIVRTLDANHDGVIDADEIANAPAALKTLDKNNDGKLSIEETMGPRPTRPGGMDGQNQGSGMGGNNRPDRTPQDDGGGDNRPPGPPPDDN